MLSDETDESEIDATELDAVLTELEIEQLDAVRPRVINKLSDINRIE